MEIQKNGFKDSSCNRKNCLGCTVKPPSLSPSVIRNLGATFCNMDEETVTEAALLKKSWLPPLGGKGEPKRKQVTWLMLLTRMLLVTNRSRRRHQRKKMPTPRMLLMTNKQRRDPRNEGWLAKLILLCVISAIFIHDTLSFETVYSWTCNNFIALNLHGMCFCAFPLLIHHSFWFLNG